ncbi:serine/arginine repetitive matrix protein 1-like [Lolium rigidum]|uniref:serine/arginine repetitive matrix protein 1-like n=1 Tax=Lolium rigidum TaxID=89674 RepID=UPI001F5D84FE|nr:serine/arginine repetitive matrix protein 1-like [Lolium rigidum]
MPSPSFPPASRRSHGRPPAASANAARKRKLSSSSFSSTPRLPLLLPPSPLTLFLPLLQLKLRDTAVEPRAPKRHRPLEPPASDSRRPQPDSPPSSRELPPPPKSKVRRRSRSPPPFSVRSRSRSPPPYKVQRRLRSPQPSKVRCRSRSPSIEHPETSSATVGNRPGPAIRGHEQKLDSKKMDGKNQSDDKAPSRSARRKKRKRQIRAEAKKEFREHSETSSGAVEKTLDPAVRGDELELHSEKIDGKNQSDHKAPSRSARRKKMRRQVWTEAKKQMREHSETSSGAVEKTPDPAVRGDELELHSEKMDGKNQSDHKAPSRSARRKKMRRQVWTEAKKQMMEMKKDKLLEKIKKLQDCAWLMEKDGADKAEIMEFRSLIESTKKQYEENEELLAQAGSSASQQHVETMAALVETVEGDEQNMDSGEAEGRSLKGCKEASKQSELAEEVNRLKSEIETVRQDRDYQSAKAQSLMADMAKQKEVARRYGVELEDAMRRVAALEERGLLESETIRTLQVQLACANEKLMVCNDLF